MKPVLNTKNEIYVSDIDEKEHIVVAVIYNCPCMLGRGYDETRDNLNFFLLGSNNEFNHTITTGNGYNFTHTEDTVQKIVIKAISMGHKVEVFNKQDWRDALNWLMDNTDITN